MPTYRIQNVVGNAATRTHRALAAAHHRSKLFVGGLRLIRGNQVEISEDVFKANELELYRLLAAGQITITCPDGTLLSSSAPGKILSHTPGKAAAEVPLPGFPTAAPVSVAPKIELPVETFVDKAVEMSDFAETGSAPAEASPERHSDSERSEYHKSKKRR